LVKIGKYIMSRLYINIISIFILINLTGCYVPFMGGGIFVFPSGSSTKEVKTKNYSNGPVSTPEFASLISEAIDGGVTEIKVLGAANWIFPGHLFDGIAAVTDKAIILIKWYKPDNEYKIIKRLAFNEILSIAIDTRRGANLYMRHSKLNFEDISFEYNVETHLQFVKSIWQDSEKTETAYNYLKNLIKVHELAIDYINYDDYDDYENFEQNPDDTEPK